MIKLYVNLTNGIEYLKTHPGFPGEEISFLRIQSTKCEGKHWIDILNELDNDFLMNLAIGNACVVIDYSNKRERSRAIYQGLEWIKYVLYRIWFNKKYIPIVKDKNVSYYFGECYKIIDRKTKIRLKYFKKFLMTTHLSIGSISSKTKKDGDIKYYKKIIKKWIDKKNSDNVLISELIKKEFDNFKENYYEHETENEHIEKIYNEINIGDRVVIY